MCNRSNHRLNHHRVPATISGGTVRSRLVSFDLQTQIAAGLERILGLKRDLGSALGVGDVGLIRNNGRWHLQVPRPEDPPVPLFRLMAATPPLSPCPFPSVWMKRPTGVAEFCRTATFSRSRGQNLPARAPPRREATSRQSQCQLQILIRLGTVRR
jgi:hypothetical protein